jgi:hypothetical protein
MILTRDQILKSNDIETITVPVPEWGGEVLVKTMSGKERDDFEQSLFEGQGKDRKQNLKNLRAKLVSRTIVDESGKRLFTDSDIDLLGTKSASALDRVFEVSQKQNKISNDDVEEMAGNLSPSQSE